MYAPKQDTDWTCTWYQLQCVWELFNRITKELYQWYLWKSRKGWYRHLVFTVVYRWDDYQYMEVHLDLWSWKFYLVRMCNLDHIDGTIILQFSAFCFLPLKVDLLKYIFKFWRGSQLQGRLGVVRSVLTEYWNAFLRNGWESYVKNAILKIFKIGLSSQLTL